MRKFVGVAAVVGVSVAFAAFLVLRDGDRAWRVERERRQPDLLMADDTMVCGNDVWEVFCLDLATGDELFHIRGADLMEVLAVSDGTVLIGESPVNASNGTVLRALGRDGRQQWQVTGSYDLSLRVPVIDGVAVVPADDLDRSLQGVDLATGEQVWEAPYPGEVVDVLESPYLVGATVTDGENVYRTMIRPGRAGDPRVEIVAIDPATGDAQWGMPVGDVVVPTTQVQGAAAVDGTDTTALVVGTIAGGRRLVLLDRTTGEISAEVRLGDRPADVATLDGTVIVLTDDELRGYSPDGDELWAQTVPVREMAADRRAVLYSGDVVAVDDTLYLDTTRVWTVDPETGDRAHTVAGDGIGAFAATSEIVVIADACCPVRGYIEARHVDG